MSVLNGLIYACTPTGAVQANCCILGNPETGNYILSDVGGDADRVMNKVKAMGLKQCVAIFFTHGHFDHVSGAKEIKQLTGAPLCLHEADVDLYGQIEMQCKHFGVPIVKDLPPIDRKLKNGDQIELDGHVGVIMHVPGHSPGSSALYFKDQDLLINGDTLFQGSFGRTDLWGGNAKVLKRSITEVLFSLPLGTIVVTGHGPNTSISIEKKTNMIRYY